jgi:hypothetical protein
LDRVSNYERKLWIAEEHYRQQNYGIHLMSDASFSLLCQTQGTLYRAPNDAANYSILSNQTYTERLNFKSLVLCQHDEVQRKQSELVTKALY